MKKLVCLLLVAVLATSLFAGVSVSLGLGYDKINAVAMGGPSPFKTKREAFSFTAGAAYVHKNGFVLFDDFSILFGDNAYAYISDESLAGSLGTDFGWVDMTEDGVDPTFSYKNHLGVGYVFPFDLPVRIMLGLDYAFSKTVFDCEDADYHYTNNVINKGVGLNGKVLYSFNNGLNAYADAKVDFMFKQTTESIDRDSYSYACDNNTLTVNYGFTAGLIYTF